jgi:hypothetical protein
MRLTVRSIPWLLALTGLAIPLVGTGFVIWPLVAVWVVILALVWSLGRAGLAWDRTLRVTIAVGLLPVLFLLAWEGGWFLVPADIAWLVIELADRGETIRARRPEQCWSLTSHSPASTSRASTAVPSSRSPRRSRLSSIARTKPRLTASGTP